ncbi:putative Na+-dependent transporter [Thermoplasmatales archaeon BRNA1]|nr:putative Na+-dependent transporter [Thermoplasmatales archaeon BRNA1]
MAAIDLLTDNRYWVAAGVVIALIVGSAGEMTSTLVIVALMLQMIASMEGLSFRGEDFRKESKPIVWSFVCCFGVCTLATLAIGSLFIGPYRTVWYGWVMLAAVPSAVSVISLSLMMRGNRVMSVLALTATYVVALGLTPLITTVLIGDAISPLEIFKYVLLFIAIPLLANIPLRRVPINRRAKLVFINVMFFSLLVLSIGKNRDFIFSEPYLVSLIIGACLIRTFAVSLVMIAFMKRRGAERDNSVVYMGFAVWKNSGLATTMCLALLPGMPESALPCALSLMIESIWFAVMTGYIGKTWPHADSPFAC